MELDEDSGSTDCRCRKGGETVGGVYGVGCLQNELCGGNTQVKGEKAKTKTGVANTRAR